VRLARGAATVALMALAATGCHTKPVDYQSVWTTSSSPTSTEAPVPISSYLESVGVTGQPVIPEKLTDLTVTLPRPKGWEQYDNPNLAPGTRATPALIRLRPTAPSLLAALPRPDCGGRVDTWPERGAERRA